MSDSDQTMTWLGDGLPHRLSAFDEFENADDRPAADPATGLVSLGFITAALRRRMRLWCALALAGLVLGVGWYAKSPPSYKAAASVVLADNPNQDPAIEVLTDQALAESIPVAAGVVRELGLKQTPVSFAGTYTIAVATDQVLTITATAASGQEAVRRAAAVATQFLKFRAQYEQTQQQDTDAQLQQQVSQAQQHLNSVTSQISQLSSRPNTPAQQLKSLQAQRTAATNALAEVRQYVTQAVASAQTTTRGMVQGSQVLNAATAVKHSARKTALLDAIMGLVGGLALGMVIVILGAVTSDRLRRRDDIAYAFGAPVKLSVGALRERRRIPGPRGKGGTRRRDMDRVVDHLRNSVPGSSRGPAGLAVVAVDDTPTAARTVVALAVSIARQPRRVVLADLSAGARAARLLGVKGPGITAVTPQNTRIVVVVPAADDVAPVGPLRSRTSPDGYAQADESLAAECAEADLVLSLVTLDPAFGGEHIATWATDVVAVVTAGRSTAVRIQAAGELIRLAGLRLGSVVVLDADKSDESLGIVGEHRYQSASR